LADPVISGIGVDIETIGRFRDTELIGDKATMKKIFTPNELVYCRGYADPAPHLAARFAAKEAIIKALAFSGITISEFSRIEILTDKSGIPHAQIQLAGIDKIRVHISLSHNLENAIAFAVVMQ